VAADSVPGASPRVPYDADLSDTRPKPSQTWPTTSWAARSRGLRL